MTPRLLIVICLMAAAGGGLWLLLGPQTTDTPGGGAVEEATVDAPEQGATLEGDQPTTPRPDSSTAPASETARRRLGSREALAAQEARAETEAPAPLEKVQAKVRILLPGGGPATGTHVMLRSRDGTVVFEETVAGATFVLDVPPGRYELIARGPDSTFLHNRAFVVTRAGDDNPLDLQLHTVPSLHMRIVRAQASTAGESEPKGEAGAEVIAVRTRARFGSFEALRKRAVHEGVTDTDGRAVLGAAEPGTYVLYALLQDGSELQFTYKHPTSSGALMRIEAQRLVPLNVIDATRRGPVPGARVHVMGRASRGGAAQSVWITADRNGQAMIPMGSSGAPSLEVEADGYLSWPAGTYSGRRKAMAPMRSTLWRWREGMEVPSLELTSGVSGPWRVRVQTRDGTPKAGVPVSLRRPNTGDHQPAELEIQSDARGIVEIEHVPNVGYRVTVAAADWQSPTPVGLDPGRAVDPDAPIVLEIEPRYSAYGRVVDSDGRAVAGARVWIGYSHPSKTPRPAEEVLFKETFTGADGRWRLTGLHSHVAYLFNAAWNGQRADPTTGSIWRAQMPLELVLKPAINLQIQVRELRSGNDLPGASVTLRSNPIYNTPPRRYTADARGRVAVQNLLPGTWELLAASAMHLKGEWVPLELAGQSGTIEHTLVLDPGLMIAGRVEDPDGLPVRAAVTLSGRQDNPPGGRISRRVDTDAQGNFRITGLVPGEYTIMAFIDGTRRRATANQLTGGETSVVLVLK